MFEAISHSSGNTECMQEFPGSLFQGNFEPGFKLDLGAKDVGLATELGRQLRLPMELANIIEQRFTEARNRGWGELASVSVAQLQEGASGCKDSCEPLGSVKVRWRRKTAASDSLDIPKKTRTIRGEYMKVGTFMMPLHPPEKDRTQTFEEDVECVIWADELGFSEAWIGQHHTAGWEPIPSNDVFIAHMLPQTKNIRLGTGVLSSPTPSRQRRRQARLSRSPRERQAQRRFWAGRRSDRLGVVRSTRPANSGTDDPRSAGYRPQTLARGWTFSISREITGTSSSTKRCPNSDWGQVLQPSQNPTPTNRNAYRQGRVYGRHDRAGGGDSFQSASIWHHLTR